MNATVRTAATVDVPLERDVFLRSLIRELAGTLEDTIGLEDAAGYISVVGSSIGEQLNASYRSALQVERLSKTQVADVLVDLKRRIQGRFEIVEQTDTKIVFTNSACPFAEKVEGRPSMCMMTSNVFGTIAAENMGYAKVQLQETIAEGHGRCVVVVHLKPGGEADDIDGREYFSAS